MRVCVGSVESVSMCRYAYLCMCVHVCVRALALRQYALLKTQSAQSERDGDPLAFRGAPAAAGLGDLGKLLWRIWDWVFFFWALGASWLPQLRLTPEPLSEALSPDLCWAQTLGARQVQWIKRLPGFN